MIHSGPKLQNSIDKAPEQGTDIELTPVLEYRSKVNQEDNNDLTKVINNEHLHVEKPVLNSSSDNGKICTKKERMQVSIDRPSGEIFVGNEIGNGIENQMDQPPLHMQQQTWTIVLTGPKH